MTYTAILLIGEHVPKDCYDKSLESYIDSLGDASAKARRKIAYSLMTVAYKEIFGGEVRLSYTHDGKPFLKDSELFISISKRDMIYAVSFSDAPVGVDAEQPFKKDAIQRVVKRFVNIRLQNIIKSAVEAEVKYIFYGVSDDGKIKKISAPETDKISSPDGEAARLWTALEAVLKTERGFIDFTRAEKIAVSCTLSTIKILDFVVTTAIKSDKAGEV